MNFRFHPDAEQEFLEAVEYYEEVDTGLGHRGGHEKELPREYFFRKDLGNYFFRH